MVKQNFNDVIFTSTKLEPSSEFATVSFDEVKVNVVDVMQRAVALELVFAKKGIEKWKICTNDTTITAGDTFAVTGVEGEILLKLDKA